MNKKEKDLTGRNRQAFINPMINFDSNQGFYMPNYAQKPNPLQHPLILSEVSIANLKNLGFWRDDDAFVQRIIEKRACPDCKKVLNCEIYSNTEYCFTFAVCRNCFKEIFFEHFSYRVNNPESQHMFNMEDKVQ